MTEIWTTATAAALLEPLKTNTTELETSAKPVFDSSIAETALLKLPKLETMVIETILLTVNLIA